VHGTDVTGVRNPNTLLNPIKVREIREEYEDAVRSQKYSSKKEIKIYLALKYNVTKACIDNIVYNTAWKGI
jgi:hypothetical protein